LQNFSFEKFRKVLKLRTRLYNRGRIKAAQRSSARTGLGQQRGISIESTGFGHDVAFSFSNGHYSPAGFCSVADITGAYWNIKENSIRAARFSRVCPVPSAR